MAKKYIVRLTEDERTYLENLIHKGKVAAHKRLHAEILLKADMSELGEKWQDSQISEAPRGTGFATPSQTFDAAVIFIS